ncbi:MAG: OadG family protein [Ruminococcus sp.]|nr:OadG family protein [Ruminococcus sp.]
MFLSTLAKTAQGTENIWELSLNVLITGIVVVFAVLLLLILLIKLYSTIVYKAQNRAPKAPKGGNDGNVAQAAVIQNNGAMAVAQPQGLTDELVAVITAAAVACMGNSNIRVTGIRKRTTRSEWSDAALRENVQPFRMGDWK